MKTGALALYEGRLQSIQNRSRNAQLSALAEPDGFGFLSATLR